MEVIIEDDQQSQVYSETSEEDVKMEKKYPEYEHDREKETHYFKGAVE